MTDTGGYLRRQGKHFFSQTIYFSQNLPMTLLATITQTKSTSIPVRNAGNTSFDDLDNPQGKYSNTGSYILARWPNITSVGDWPNKQNVKAIRELIFYTDNPVTKVVGFDVTYDLVVGTQVKISHGKQTRVSTIITIECTCANAGNPVTDLANIIHKADQLVTGIFGQLQNNTNLIASINVVLFDGKKGKVTLKGWSSVQVKFCQLLKHHDLHWQDRLAKRIIIRRRYSDVSETSLVSLAWTSTLVRRNISPVSMRNLKLITSSLDGLLNLSFYKSGDSFKGVLLP